MRVPKVRFSLTAVHGFALILHRKQEVEKNWEIFSLKRNKKNVDILSIAAVVWLLINDSQEDTQANCVISMTLWPRKTMALLYLEDIGTLSCLLLFINRITSLGRRATSGQQGRWKRRQSAGLEWELRIVGRVLCVCINASTGTTTTARNWI